MIAQAFSFIQDNLDFALHADLCAGNKRFTKATCICIYLSEHMCVCVCGGMKQSLRNVKGINQLPLIFDSSHWQRQQPHPPGALRRDTKGERGLWGRVAEGEQCWWLVFFCDIAWAELMYLERVCNPQIVDTSNSKATSTQERSTRMCVCVCVGLGVCVGKYVSQRSGKDIQPRHISKSCVCRVPHPLIYLFVYLLSIYEPVCNVSVSVSASARPLPPPESLPSSLPLPICSALLRSRQSVRYARFVVAVLAAYWHWQGVGRVVLWSGKCKWQWRMVTVTATETKTKGETETETETLCRCRCRLWSRRRLASLAAHSSQLSSGRWCRCDSIPGI